MERCGTEMRTGFYLYIVLFFSILILWDSSVASTPDLQKISRKITQTYHAKKERARNFAISSGFPIRKTLPTDRVIEIQDLLLNRPLYYITTNSTAARTISTLPLWSRGNGGTGDYNLDGEGMIIAMWDEGGVRFSHRELVGRVQKGDDTPHLSNHATQVAGTLIARGYNENARGMAPLATLESFDWNNDLAEMATMAAATFSDPSRGLLVSNHSYSYLLGWEWNYYGDNRWVWFGDSRISTDEDYLFGFYDDFAQSVDELACAAPYYLMVFSAGNDRKDLGPVEESTHWYFDWDAIPPKRQESEIRRHYDGLYDCISNGGAIAKNSLTVGAVEGLEQGYSGPDDVLMSWFGAWGPADDGRIKPDVVADGVGLITTGAGSDYDYTTVNGTSFAAPGVVGSLALLQEYYQRLHNRRMLSSTLKALVIHAADEAGKAPGPDYAFGWGLMNTKKAADLIEQDSRYMIPIQERKLEQNRADTLRYYCSGETPIKVTLAWTDPAGEPVEPQLDPAAAMLINDLDLKIENGKDIFYPWILDPGVPEQKAETGMNSVDNVEQVAISDPEKGFYTLTIHHKDNLYAGEQTYSLIITGLASIDMGNAPVDRYPTLLDRNGAYHLLNPGIFLGNKIERDQDESVAGPTGDDALKSDNDGVIFTPYMTPDRPQHIKILTHGQGFLYGWMDFNADGDWQDPGEQIFNAVPATTGQHLYSFTLPQNVVAGKSFARFRYTSQKELDFSGPACDGEVEDYQYVIYADRDHDGIPNILEEQDRDQNGVIDSLQYTASGYIYDELTGRTVMGGKVELFSPDGELIPLVADGHKGFYNFGMLSDPGEYALEFTPPAGYRPSQTCHFMNVFQPEGELSFLGRELSMDSQTLSSHRCEENPYALMLRITEPAFISLNNIPVSGVVPVELSSFTAECRNGRVYLRWTTRSETENLGFHLFRTSGERKRITTAMIPGAGNSQTGRSYEYIDKDIKVNKKYLYELIDIDFQGYQTVHGPVEIYTKTPAQFELEQNYPNPFNPQTRIVYHLDRDGHCELSIFNLNGRLVRNLVDRFAKAGSHITEWNGRDEGGQIVPSGVYLYRLKFENRVKTKKMSFIH
jgi:subtilisin family serine protease